MANAGRETSGVRRKRSAGLASDACPSLPSRVSRSGCYAAHRVEHDDGELGARLVLLQVDGDEGPSRGGTAAVTRARMVEGEGQHVAD